MVRQKGGRVSELAMCQRKPPPLWLGMHDAMMAHHQALAALCLGTPTSHGAVMFQLTFNTLTSPC